jgi:hypothetical protein
VLAARRIVARECLSKALPIERARGFRLHPRKKADRGRAERAPGSSQAPSRDEVSRPGVARESLARCVAREAPALAPFATRSAHRGARPRRVCPNATLTPPSTHPPAIISQCGPPSCTACGETPNLTTNQHTDGAVERANPENHGLETLGPTSRAEKNAANRPFYGRRRRVGRRHANNLTRKFRAVAAADVHPHGRAPAGISPRVLVRRVRQTISGSRANGATSRRHPRPAPVRDRPQRASCEALGARHTLEFFSRSRGGAAALYVLASRGRASGRDVILPRVGGARKHAGPPDRVSGARRGRLKRSAG